jgi:hypothetical protein
MITLIEFEKLIESPETSILDFKTILYELIDDKDLKHTAKFIKDVISLANTIRNETAYIIIGIEEEKEEGNKILRGLDKNIDDAVFQDKIKDKVYPMPVFCYYTILYKEKKFGIIEIPVSKYISPIHPIIKMTGLEIGRIYFRRGTMNSEAIGHEIINIGNWLQSLPESNEFNILMGPKTRFGLIPPLLAQVSRLVTFN